MLPARPGLDSSPDRAATGAANDEIRNPSSQTPDTPGLAGSIQELLSELAGALNVPMALLSREREEWQFEAEAFPLRPVTDVPRVRAPHGRDWAAAAGGSMEYGGTPWTGLLAGTFHNRDWLLIVPGSTERWRDTPGIDGTVAEFSRGLEAVVRQEDDRRLATSHRRLYAFSRRLTRPGTPAETHHRILKTMADEVGAQTGAFALYDEAEQALTITATIGYPLAIVEHVRVMPGEGAIGEAFASRRATLGRVDERTRRLRYRSDSFMVVPLLSSGRCLAVVALTDRADDRPFDSRDLRSVRLFAAPAVLALARHRVSASLDELTRAATVDAVTGLFNRRHFQTRLQAEVQRARRQKQDLALLMVDIDDFKRINDTLGHLEGDRALRDVADLLRRGVRIFDICARYGGEEFAIVMPGATRQVAVQVAERIRRGMEDRSRLTPLPMTVSIGVGLLGPDQTEEQLIDAADRSLMAAKRAGKNVVKTDG